MIEEVNVSRGPSPYRVKWPQHAVETLRAKVREYELPEQPVDASWQYGCDPSFLDSIRKYWADGFDFEGATKEANRFPQFVTEVEPGVEIHFVHIVGEAGGRRPLLLAHGWPSAVYEFWKIVEPLVYPSKFSGFPEDAFDIVIPTLPGFGASFKPRAPIASDETARWYHRLMQQLGYPRYFAHGADIGSDVVWRMAAFFPESLLGVHFNDLKMNKTIPIWPAEFKWILDSKKADKKLGAYFQLQQTKPESLAFAMVNNPVGQLAWIIERFHDWSDLRSRPFEEIYTKDQLIGFVMSYYLNKSFATSIWFYYARGKRGTIDKKIEVPTGVSPFPDPRTPPAPKSFVERNFNLVHWVEPTTGGHFAALEEPEKLTQILREWARACELVNLKAPRSAPDRAPEATP